MLNNIPTFNLTHTFLYGVDNQFNIYVCFLHLKKSFSPLFKNKKWKQFFNQVIYLDLSVAGSLHSMYTPMERPLLF